jgi:tetratricopeptide (TPR) repeat protein
MLKKYDDAIFAYQKALYFGQNCQDGDFDSFDAEFNLASAYFATKKYNDALSVYNKLAQNRPADLRLWYNMAETHTELEQYEQALACYQKATPIKNQLPYFNIRLANCLEKLGRDHEAMNTLQDFVQICQNQINTSNNGPVVQIHAMAKNMLQKLEQKHIIS